MIQTLNFTSFANAFRNSESRANQFSYEALELIFDYYEQYEDETGEQVEFDMIGICCEWAEEDAATLAQYYAFDVEGLEGDELTTAVEDYMKFATLVAGTTCAGKIVYVQF